MSPILTSNVLPNLEGHWTLDRLLVIVKHLLDDGRGKRGISAMSG